MRHRPAIGISILAGVLTPSAFHRDRHFTGVLALLAFYRDQHSRRHFDAVGLPSGSAFLRVLAVYDICLPTETALKRATLYSVVRVQIVQ